jgi:uncharacterized protein (TIGR03118 family)
MMHLFRTRSKSKHVSAAKIRSYRPFLEAMEDRQLPSVTAFQPVSLVSDQAGHALIQDPNLINSWGIALPPTGGNFWISDNGTGMSTLYTGDANGMALTKVNLNVNIPGGAPTGVVFNGTSDFVVNDGAGHSGPAVFLFASENGGITGWNPNVPPPSPSASAQTGATVPNAVFKGLALASNATGNVLYAADFHDNHIVAFSPTFAVQSAPTTAFVDPNLPAGYAPFNIANFGGTLFVTYALQDGVAHDDVPGPGHGFIDAFDTSGNFLRRVASGGVLNSPWGMTMSPANFGSFSNDLLVGNFGDGTINAFNPTTGAFVGTLTSGANHPIVIDGLWGLTFGNGTAGSTNTLYFTAGPGGEAHGLFGKITMATGTNVDNQIHVALVGLHRLPHSDFVSGMIQLHNFGAPITGPVTLLISNLPAGVTLVGANVTQTPNGAMITISPSNIGRHGHVTFGLVFENSGHVPLSAFRNIQLDVFSATTM